MKKKFKYQKGFTLVELIVYIAIVTVFISGAILFTWDIIYGRVKSKVQRDLNQNMRFSVKRINFEIKNASGLNYVNSNEICLANTDSSYNPVRIYESGQRLYIAWGGGSVDCTTMTFSEPLISTDVVVSNLSFLELSSNPQSININYEITLESVGDRTEWKDSQTYTSSVELRSN